MGHFSALSTNATLSSVKNDVVDAAMTNDEPSLRKSFSIAESRRGGMKPKLLYLDGFCISTRDCRDTRVTEEVPQFIATVLLNLIW